MEEVATEILEEALVMKVEEEGEGEERGNGNLRALGAIEFAERDNAC